MTVHIELPVPSPELDSEVLLRETVTRLHLESEEPRLILLMHSDNGAALCVGVGTDLSVLTYTPADPPYYVSLGEASRPGLFNFELSGEWSEFSGDAMISVESAIDAACQFLRTGELPTCVTWQLA